MEPWRHIERHIGEATGEGVSDSARTALGGGCINSAFRLEAPGRSWFVKLNDAARVEMFAAEAEGLAALAAAGAIRVPAPVCWGAADGRAYLVLETLDLGGSGSMETFARQLAALHRAGAPRFGWHRDNTIGATPQPNDPADDWVEFWRERRLGFQLDLARRNGAGRALLRGGEALLERFGALFATYRPQPSLLHGDLWGGNYAFTRAGEPVIYDPAVYYGDREADLAMTELFGGFGGRFYAAYREEWPLDPGYAVRKVLYNLYHILNHFNLFGGGYGAQAQGMVERLLAELR